MQTKLFGENALSRLGFGTMRLPIVDGDAANIDYDKAAAMIDYAYNHGVNYFDTAYIYHSGKSENFLGKAMPQYPRDSYHTATKFLINVNPDYKQVFAQQREKMQAEYIDFYLIHSVTDDNADKYIESGAIDYFLEQKRLGTIKHLGFSFHGSVDCLRKFINAAPWEFVQIQLNAYDWQFGTAKEEYDIIAAKGLPIIVMEPVRGGKLANLSPAANAALEAAAPGRSVASWALRWVLGLEQVQLVLSGMSTLEQVQDNVATFSACEPLTEAENALYLQVLQDYKKALSVPCTACRYCCDECPLGLEIPALLDLYNAMKLDGPFGIAEQLAALPADKHPQNCVACGACMNHCPQSIQIPEKLAELAGVK